MKITPTQLNTNSIIGKKKKRQIELLIPLKYFSTTGLYMILIIERWFLLVERMNLIKCFEFNKIKMNKEKSDLNKKVQVDEKKTQPA